MARALWPLFLLLLPLLPSFTGVWKGRATRSWLRANSKDDLEGLVGYLQRAQLGDRVASVMEWCEEQGASCLEEVFENLEELREDLQLDTELLGKVFAMQKELHAVCSENQMERLKEIVAFCDLEAMEENCTALQSAAQQGHTEVLRLLLSHGAKVNARDAEGRTALHLAAFQGHTEALVACRERNGSEDEER